MSSELTEVTASFITATYSISDLVESYIYYGTVHNSATTIPTRKSHLKALTEYCEKKQVKDIRDVTNPLMDEFFSEYQIYREKSTVNTRRRIIKTFLRWVSEYKEIPLRVRPDAIRLVREKKPLPQAVDDDIILEVISKCKHEQDALMIATFRESGIRPCEIVEIKVDDLLDRQILIFGKGEKERLVNITSNLEEELREFAARNGRVGDEWLFQNVYKGYGAKMNPKTVTLRVKKCFETTGKNVYSRKLRHSMAVGLLSNGSDLITIQNQLGHRYVTTTQTYLRLNDKKFREGYEKGMPNSFI